MSASLNAVVHLRTVSLFDGLDAKELAPVAAITNEQVVAPNTTVFEDGAAGEHMYIIIRGRVEVVQDGRRVATLGPGDCFGEMAVLDRATRSATVRTLDAETRLLTLAREDFQFILELYASVARGVALVLARRLRGTFARLDDAREGPRTER